MNRLQITINSRSLSDFTPSALHLQSINQLFNKWLMYRYDSQPFAGAKVTEFHDTAIAFSTEKVAATCLISKRVHRKRIDY